MSKESLTIKLPKNVITTLQRIGKLRDWSVKYLIEDAIMETYKEEITADVIELYLELGD